MRNLTIYLVVFLCLLFSKMFGQETFEKRAETLLQKLKVLQKKKKQL